VSTALPDLPRYLVLEPVSTIRLEIDLASPACEIDVELENPRPGRSFLLLIGHRDGPYVQRVRLAGKARIHFDPQAPGLYRMLLANPNSEPLVLRLRGRDLPAAPRPRRSSAVHRKRTARRASGAAPRSPPPVPP
jgi:hypothetical protein